MDLGKLRFYWAGDYNAATEYESNDIVRYGGNVFVYIYGLKTAGNPPTDTTYWAKMVEGMSFDGVWASGTTYQAGDSVTHGGVVYIASQTTTGNTPPNATYWSVFADGIQWEDAYNNATGYQKNDVVSYGPSIYIAKQNTTGNLPTDTTYWDKFVEGISASAVYNAATAYVPNDLVAYGVTSTKPLQTQLATYPPIHPNGRSSWQALIHEEIGQPRPPTMSTTSYNTEVTPIAFSYHTHLELSQPT